MGSLSEWSGAVASIRAFLAAFLGSLAWFIWTAAHQNNRSCYPALHYVPSAAIAFGVIVAVVVASRRPWGGRPVSLLIVEGAATAAWAGLGLAAANYVALLASCSG